LNVFKEAKLAYLERKAEIAAVRQQEQRELQRPKTVRALTIDDAGSTTSSHRSRRSRRSTHREHRHRSDHNDARSETSRRHSDTRSMAEGLSKEPRVKITYLDEPPMPLGSLPAGFPTSPYPPAEPRQLVRSHTIHEGEPLSLEQVSAPRRAKSVDGIDMDLAYGEAPPNLMAIQQYEEEELTGLVGRVKFLLDEANCVQHSVSSTMASLQKNPDAMAAVALTLAEISNLAKKMAPGVLSKIKILAPSVFALLTSPQFLIAAGVGVGVTVIALGGYKVIKKIQGQKEEPQEEESMDQMIALSSEVSRIENWRQGIADVESRSVGTSVDGEFITPMAATMSRLNLAEYTLDNELPQESSHYPKAPKSTKSVRTSRSKSSRSVKTKDKDEKERKEKKKPKPSPLRSLFKV
jgi:hypothetical protein